MPRPAEQGWHMAFAVMVGHGQSKLIVKFPTAAQALSEARN